MAESQTVGTIEVPVKAAELKEMRAEGYKPSQKQLAELGQKVVDAAGMVTVRGYANRPEATFLEREDGTVVLKPAEVENLNGGYVATPRVVVRSLDGYNLSFRVFSPRPGTMLNLNAIMALSKESDTKDRQLIVIRTASDALTEEPTTEYTRKDGKKGTRRTAAIELPFVNSVAAQSIASYPRENASS